MLNPATEFTNFSILLSKDKWFNKISNYQELDRIKENKYNNQSNSWKYEIAKLKFKNINLERHVRPSKIYTSIKSGECEAKLLLTVFCDCIHNDKADLILDTTKTIGAKFEVQCDYLCNESGDVKFLHSSWHIDKHDSTKQVSSIHPLFHFEYGNSELNKSEDFNFGDFIILDTPRIMHPPLDIVLGIDFVIKNFYQYKDHYVLTENPLYKKYIENAQMRLWKPYFISLASKFHNFGTEYTIQNKLAENILECHHNKDFRA